MARRRATAGIALGVGVVLLVFLALNALTAGISRSLSQRDTGAYLVLPQDAASFWGSYLSRGTGRRLRSLGAQVVAPEIFVIRQDRSDNVYLFRGVPPETYTQVNAFTLLAGRPLTGGDRQTVMIGRQVAARLGLAPGDTFTYRGRDFRVVGIFETGAISDSEIWLSLEDAQRLFHSRGYVSTFAIKGPPELAGRVEERLDLQVVAEPAVWASFTGATASLNVLLQMITAIMAGAAVLGVMNQMVTVVRQRRREIAILRSLGFKRGHVLIYVLGQSLVIALIGFMVALVVALLFGRGLQLEAMGMSLNPYLSAQTIGGALVLMLVIGLLAGAYPAYRATQVNLADTLRGE
ncbi:MAG: ABC transporter permease [Chloroflexota bacterium]